MSETRSCPYGLCDGSGSVYLPNEKRWVACKCSPGIHWSGCKEKAEIAKKYLDASFEDYGPEDADQTKALEAAKAYAMAWAEKKSNGRSLVILGPVRCQGKSHLASAICNHLITTEWTRSIGDQDVCLFVNVANWFGQWDRFFGANPIIPEEKRVIADDMGAEGRAEKHRLVTRDSRMFTTELLVLDDLTIFTKTPYKVNKLYELVDNRVSNGKPMIITDNQSTWANMIKAMGSDAGTSIVDRIKRNSDVIVIGSTRKRKS